MEKNMRIWVWVIVVVVAAAVIFFMFFDNKPKSNSSATNTTNTSNTTNTEPASSQDINAKDTGAAATPLTYAQALVQYADRRIQLDTQCQANPNNVTYKDNTGIMIDNRSPNPVTVKVGAAAAFAIKAWGFKIVVLPDVYLKSKTLMVDCNKDYNVATILVQE